MKKILISLLTLLLGLQLSAAPVKSSDARTAAVNWYKSQALAGTTDFSVKSEWTRVQNGTAVFYTFNFNAGFVLISADDVALPVLGYSTEGEMPENTGSPSITGWLNNYAAEINHLVAVKADRNVNAREWTEVLSGNITKSGAKAVTPLVTTKWNQDPSPWGMYCPPGTYAGCVAVASSQVMKFWNHPVTGTGSHSYIWDKGDNNPATNQTIATAFDSTFDWANMPNTMNNSSPIAQRKAVAKFLFRVGVSVDMDYGTDGSGAMSEAVVHALKNYFKYDQGLSMKALENYTTATWIDLLKSELDAPNSRPMYYAGSDPNGGHAFVCDGYDASTTPKFHFNWGWSGSSDGYFAIGALNTSNGTFNLNNRVIVGIKPHTGLTVNIGEPADSSSVPLGSTVKVVANAYDVAKSVTKVDFYIDGALKSTDTDYPYSYEFNSSTLTLGYHVIKTTATDAANNTVSDQIDINVSFGSWVEQATGFTAASRGINNIFIVNPEVVWATAYDGTSTGAKIQDYTKTINGGTTWLKHEAAIATPETSYGIANMSPLSADVAYAAIFPQGSAITGCGIYKTVNGGTTWTKQPTALFSASTSFANFVHMFDANNGFCMGDPATLAGTTGLFFEIYTTADGGTTWTRVPKANIGAGYTPASDEYGTVNFYDAVGDVAWFITTKGNVLKTTDKGLTWTKTPCGATTFGSSVGIHFINPLNGILVHNSGTASAPVYKYRKTIDGGATWTELTPAGLAYEDIAPIPGTEHEWISVSANQAGPGSSYSFDDGANWVELDVGTQYTTVSFFDKYTGWAGGFSETSTAGGIFKWVSTENAIGDEPTSIIPQNATLKQNYPNPFNPTTTIEFDLKGNSQVKLSVYDAMGREVANLVNGALNAGNHAVQFDGSKLSAGVYFYSLKVQDQNAVVKKMMFVK